MDCISSSLETALFQKYWWSNMAGTVRIQDIDKGMEAAMKRIFDKADHVDIGLQPDEDETLLKIAAAHEFGAEIDHPGGTSYGYKTEKDAQAGRVQFLKKGEGYMVLGQTQPHKIVIPERSFIRSTVDENEEKYFRSAKTIMGRIIDGQLDKFQALSLLGQLVEGDIKSQIINLDSPANSAATIRKKGSDNPLVDSGLMGGSIRYAVSE